MFFNPNILKGAMRRIDITDALILLSVILSAYYWTSGAELSFSAKNFQANPLSIVSAIFAHANMLHLAGNMIFLYIFGSLVEREQGGAALAFAFFLGGIATFLLSVPIYPNAAMVGASGAIFTLAAITMLTNPLKLTIFFFMPVGAVALLFFIYNILAITQGVEGNTAFASHVIGFLIGMGLGAWWSKDWKKNILIAAAALVAYAVILNLLAGFLLG